MKLKLGYLVLSGVIFTAAVSHTQAANASSYRAARAIGNFLSNPTVITALIALIAVVLLIAKYAIK